MRKNLMILYVIFIVVTIIIIHSWFNKGKIISNTSEEDLNIFHSQKSAEYYSTFWQPVGTGYKTAFYLPRYPVFAVLGVLEQIDIPAYLRQAFLLSIVMLIGIFSMFLLIRKGLNLETPVAFVGGLFYSLNIYSMTQIWKRFLYTHMFAWSYIPLFSFLWIKWINTRKILWLLIFIISSSFFTYSFSNPVFLLTIWAPAGVYALIKTWEMRKSKQQMLFIIVSSFVGLILWCLINLWWLYPVLTLGNSWTSQSGQSWQGDFDSLRAVSQSFPVWEILLLRQSWYLGPSNNFNDFYHNPIVILINIGVLLTAVYGIIKSKHFKYKYFLLTLGFIGLFVSKGTNFPFGYTFFSFLFSKFGLTTALRNSYEKFGIVLLLPYTVYFAIGFYKVVNQFKGRFKIILSIILFTLFCGILVYPLWNGSIFPPKDRVEVPNYYIQANNFLNSQRVERIFHFPYLSESDPIIYDWGYVGIDPSISLFHSDNLSSADVPISKRILKLLPNYYNNKNITHIFGLLGVQDILLQKDITSPQIDLLKTQNQIESWSGVTKINTFGKIDIFSIDSQKIKQIIYTAGKVERVSSLNEELNVVSSSNWDGKTVFVSQNESINLKDSMSPQISFQKISPSRYKAFIKESRDPYILVLNNTYDNSWKITIDGKGVSDHFMINGFANGWLVDKKGNYDIDINLVIWPWD